MKTKTTIKTFIYLIAIAAGGVLWGSCGETTKPKEETQQTTTSSSEEKVLTPAEYKAALNERTGTAQAMALTEPSECAINTLYLLGAGGYRVDFVAAYKALVLSDYSTAEPVCKCSILTGNNDRLKLKVVTVSDSKYLDVRRGGTAWTTNRTVTGSESEQFILNFVKNNYWHPSTTNPTSKPYYKIIGSDNDRDIDQGQTVVDPAEMLYADLEANYVFIKYTDGTSIVYTATSSGTSVLDRKNHTPSQIVSERTDAQ